MNNKDLNNLAEALADALEARALGPDWLSLKEAGKIFGLGPDRLVRLALDGKVEGYQDPDDARHPWIFDRASIARYRHNLADKAREQGLKASPSRKTLLDLKRYCGA